MNNNKITIYETQQLPKEHKFISILLKNKENISEFITFVLNNYPEYFDLHPIFIEEIDLEYMLELIEQQENYKSQGITYYGYKEAIELGKIIKSYFINKEYTIIDHQAKTIDINNLSQLIKLIEESKNYSNNPIDFPTYLKNNHPEYLNKHNTFTEGIDLETMSDIIEQQENYKSQGITYHGYKEAIELGNITKSYFAVLGYKVVDHSKNNHKPSLDSSNTKKLTKIINK